MADTTFRRRPKIQLPDLDIVAERLRQVRDEQAQLERLLFVLQAPDADPKSNPDYRVHIPTLKPGTPRPTKVIGIIPPRELTPWEITEIGKAMATGNLVDILSQIESLDCHAAWVEMSPND